MPINVSGSQRRTFIPIHRPRKSSAKVKTENSTVPPTNTERNITCACLRCTCLPAKDTMLFNGTGRAKNRAPQQELPPPCFICVQPNVTCLCRHLTRPCCVALYFGSGPTIHFRFTLKSFPPAGCAGLWGEECIRHCSG